MYLARIEAIGFSYRLRHASSHLLDKCQCDMIGIWSRIDSLALSLKKWIRVMNLASIPSLSKTNLRWVRIYQIPWSNHSILDSHISFFSIEDMQSHLKNGWCQFQILILCLASQSSLVFISNLTCKISCSMQVYFPAKNMYITQDLGSTHYNGEFASNFRLLHSSISSSVMFASIFHMFMVNGASKLRFLGAKDHPSFEDRSNLYF